jgi:hypothetical protein
MASEAREWTVPTPLRALLWWPPIALVVVMVDPAPSTGTIALVGVALAVLDLGAATVRTMLGRRSAEADDAIVDVLPQAGALAERRVA